MANIKINSIGFGCDKNIKISEGLITSGIAMVIAGLAVNHFKTQWWVAGDQKTLDTVCELYDAQKNKIKS